ncbi:MAG: TerB family tellurite resistance protein [Gammaproteobacteria bacterium]|nr:TerB family tellurite resistance protein [Gammaproteobacteria bacterium]
MHIILAVLGSLVTVLWYLHRLAEMGIDLGGLNPWLWRRRRRWRKHYDANPIYKIDHPMEMTALLLVAVAKADGDMSSQEKQTLLNVFRDEFHQSERDAAGLLISSTHLLGKGDEVRSDLATVMAASLDRCSPAQAQSALELMQRVAESSGAPSAMQSDLLDAARQALMPTLAPKGKWR